MSCKMVVVVLTKVQVRISAMLEKQPDDSNCCSFGFWIVGFTCRSMVDWINRVLKSRYAAE